MNVFASGFPAFTAGTILGPPGSLILYKYVGNGIVYPWVSDDEQAHDVEMTFNDVDERSSRRIDVSARLFQRCVPVGLLNLPLRSKEQNEKVSYTESYKTEQSTDRDP